MDNIKLRKSNVSDFDLMNVESGELGTASEFHLNTPIHENKKGPRNIIVLPILVMIW
jgi:hypothetical protein